MNDKSVNDAEKLTDETRGKLKNLSNAILRLHKTLLDGAKADYESTNGKIQSPNQYLSLVLDDPHFAWLRKISSFVALIDEAVSIRRPASETDAQALFEQAKLLLNFEDDDREFNDKFQNALIVNPDAVIGYNETLGILK